MVKKSRRWGGPRPAPYNPNARDADGDGMVQEGTIWERPGGARFVNRLGQEIAAAAAAVTPGSYIVNDRGERIDYTPTWQREGAPGDVDLSPAGGLPRLGDIGMPSIGETNGTIRDTMGTVEGPPEVPDLKPDPRDVDAPDVDRVSLPDGRQEAFEAEVSTLSRQEIYERRERLAKELTEGALQGSNWTRTDGRATGNGTRPEFAVEPVATFEQDDATVARIEELGGTAFPVHELPSDTAGAQTFHDAVKNAHDTHKFGTSVTVYDAEDYEGLRLFVSPEGTAGFAVTPDGQLVSVFNSDDDVEMPLHTMVPLAISQGATRADAFDTVLPGFYAQFGLQPVSRIGFVDEYAPDGWDYDLYDRHNGGRPDVVFMRFDPDRIGDRYVPGDGFEVFDYDDGLASTADPPTIDVYPEEVSGKEGVYDAVNSLVEGQPDPEAGWVFTDSKEAIGSHGEAAEEAITSYVRNSIPINTDLRDGDISPENQETIDMFDELFEALPESEGGTVYRGAAMRTLLGDVDAGSEEELDDLIEATIGATITDDGILSTSTRPEVAVDFSKANRVDGEPEGYLVLEFDIPEGGKALGISNYPGRGESEVLLPRSSEYEVVSVQKIRKADGDHPTYVVKVAQKQGEDAVEGAARAEEAIAEVIEEATPITEIGAKDLTQYIRSFNGPRPAQWRELKSWSPTGGGALDKYSYNPEGINAKLRAGDLSPEDAAFADELSAHIAQARTEKDHTVFRGMPASAMLGDIPEEDMDAAAKALVGETVTEDGFLSTTVDSHHVDEFMYHHEGKARVGDEVPGVMLRIEVPRGARGGAAVSTAYQEEEVLYDRGTELRIKGVTKLPDVDGRDKPVYVFNAEMVTPEVAEGETPPVLQEVTKFTGHDKTAPFDGLEAHLADASGDGTVFAGLKAATLLGKTDSDRFVEEHLRKLVGEEMPVPDGLSTSVSPGEALEAANANTERYRKIGWDSQIAFRINLPEGVDEVPEGASLRVVGVEKSQPPQTRNGKLMRPATFVVEADVVGQGLSRTAEKVAADIEAAISGTLTDRIEQSILGE